MRTALRLTLAPITFAALAISASASAATLQAGPGKAFATPCAAIAAAQAGDVIEVDAGGYDDDTCAWSTDNLTVKGVGGRAKIDLKNTGPAQKKGIFTIYAPNATIESIEFSGAAISANDGNNGAGIRHQGLNLTVRDCVFHDNQNGILGGPLANGQPADGQGEVLIERSEFYANGAGDGQSHNMYLNHYAKFTLRFSYSHASDVGHLVKSRAVESHILYNRLSDDASTNVSYEVNLPNGGKAFVIGNIIEQGADPNGQENGAIVDFGSEGPMAGSDLFVVNNTIINNRMNGGTFVKVNGGVTTPAVVRNNIFVGKGTICDQPSALLDHNFSMGDPKLADQANLDAHLLMGSPCVDMGVDPGMGDGQSLAPTYHYVHPANYEVRTSVGTIDIGAYELGGGGGAGGGGAGGGSASSSSGMASSSSGMASSSSGMASSSSSGSSGTTTGQGGMSGGGGEGGNGGGSGEEGGCGCRVSGDHGGAGALAALSLLGAVAARRRRR